MSFLKIRVGLFDGAVRILSSDQPWIQLICLTTLCDDNGRLQYGRFHCPILIKTSVKVVIPSSQLQQRIHIVHDCSSGQCEFELTRHGMVEEREEVQRDSLTNKHDYSNNRYLFNRFFLGCSAVNLNTG